MILTIVFRHETTLDELVVPFHYYFGQLRVFGCFTLVFTVEETVFLQRRGDPFNFISPAPPLSCALHPRRREKGAPGPRFTSSLRPSRPRSVLPPSPTRRHTVRTASIAKDREKITDYLDTYTRTPARFERGIRRDS